MGSKLGNIITGHMNELTGQNEELFQLRYAICKVCPNFETQAIGEVCGMCGCRLQAKLRVERERCPLGEWE